MDTDARQVLDAVPIGLQVWETGPRLLYANGAAGCDVPTATIQDACVDQREHVVELARWRVRLLPLGQGRVLAAFEDLNEERLNRAIVGHLQEGVLVVHRDGTILEANDALARLCRVPRIEPGANVRDLPFDIVALDGRPLAVEETPRVRALRGEALRGVVVRLLYPDGGGAWVEVNASPLTDHDGAAPFASVITYEDVSERFEAERRVRHDADHDPLTGVPNRRALERTLAAAIARAEHQRRAVAVLVLDLDGFKAVNDALGHAAGDATLREVAVRLLASVRDRDLVARTGGDEFVIVLSDLATGSDAAERCRARVAAALAASHVVDGASVPLRAAVGVAHFPRDGLDGGALLASADRAMYAAKAAG